MNVIICIFTVKRRMLSGNVSKTESSENDVQYNGGRIHGVYRANSDINQVQNRDSCCYILKKGSNLLCHPEYNRCEDCKHFSDVCHGK